MGTVKLEPLGQRLLLTGGRCCTVTWVQSAILEDETTWPEGRTISCREC